MAVLIRDFPPRLREAVAECSLFAGVNYDDFAARQRDFHEDEVICKHGDLGSCLWIVAEGVVGVRLTKTVAHRHRGEVIGEQALLEPDGRRTAELFALGGRVTLIEIAARDLVLTANGVLASNLAALLSKKLAASTVQRDEANQRLEVQQELLRQYLGEYALNAEQLRPKSRATPDHELVRVVMFFSDVVGYSQLAAKLDPVETADLVRRLLEPQYAAIQARGGHVDKPIGDAVMAYWILDEGTEATGCECALQAAEEALAGVRLVTVDGVRCDLRVGLHVGEVVAGVFGTKERRSYTIIGDAVNIAGRYEQARSQGDIVLGAIRASTEFCAYLEPAARTRLPVPFRAEAKISIEGFTNAQ